MYNPPTPQEAEELRKIEALKIPPPITSIAKFANCFLELIVEKGHGDKNCIVKGFTDKITTHKEARAMLVTEKRATKQAKKEYEAADAVSNESHAQYVSISADAPDEEDVDPETFIMYIKNRNRKLRKNGQFDDIQRVPTIEEVEDMLENKRKLREKIEQAHRYHVEMKQKAEHAKRAAASVFQRYNMAYKREREAKAEVTADHLEAQKKEITLMEIFPKVHFWDAIVSINGIKSWNLPFVEIVEIMKDEPPPHTLEFGRYLYRQNMCTGEWYSFEQLAEQKKYVPNDQCSDLLFMKMCREGDVHTVKDMLDHGHDVQMNNQDEVGNTGMHYAAANGHIDIVELLLKEGASYTIANHNGRTPFFLSVSRGCLESAQLFLRFGMDVDALDRQGKSVLIRAVMSGEEKLVDLLVERRADASFVDSWGWTLLHHACRTGSTYLVKKFIDGGLSPYTRTREGKLPHDIAHAAGHKHVEAFISAHIFHEPAQLIGRYWGGELWLGSQEAAARSWALQRGIQVVVSVKENALAPYNKLRWLEDNDNYPGMQVLVDKNAWNEIREEDGNHRHHHHHHHHHHNVEGHDQGAGDENKNNSSTESKNNTGSASKSACEVEIEYDVFGIAKSTGMGPWKGLLPHLLKTHNFVHKYLRRKKTVLVHCDQGTNLSTAVVVHYLMTKLQMKFDDAVQHVHMLRPVVKLSPSIMIGLQEFEEQLMKMRLEVARNKLRNSAIVSLGF